MLFSLLFLLFVAGLMNVSSNPLSFSKISISTKKVQNTIQNSVQRILQIRGGSKVKHITDAASFDDILSSAGDKLVIVDFSASW
jgi:hypothetical protein